MSLVEKYNKLPKPFKASMWFVICTFLQSGISFITTPIFTRILSTAEYGQYSVVMSWKSIITAFVSLNIFSAVYTQGLVKFENDKKQYSSSMYGLLSFLCLIWIVVYFLFASFWENLLNLSREEILIIIGLIFTSGIYSLWAAEERTKYKYVALIIVTLLSSLLKPLIGIFAVLNFDEKVTARILSMLLVEAVCYSWILIRRRNIGGSLFSKKYWKYALAMNFPLIPHYLSQTVLNSSDRIMINELIDSSASGIYSLASSISQIMIIFTSAIIQSMNPWIFQKIKTKKTEDIKSIAYFALAFIAFVNILLIGFAPEIVSVFGSDEYREAIWVIPPIAMSVYFMFAYSLFATFEFYYEKTHIISIATFISAILNVLLNYIFIPIYGYIAAGYTTLLCYVLYSIFHLVSMVQITKKNHINNPYKIMELFIISIVFMLIDFSFLLLYNNSLLRFLSIVLVLLAGWLSRNKFIWFWNKLQREKNNHTFK